MTPISGVKRRLFLDFTSGLVSNPSNVLAAFTKSLADSVASCVQKRCLLTALADNYCNESLPFFMLERAHSSCALSNKTVGVIGLKQSFSSEQRLTANEIKQQSLYKIDFIRGMLKLKTTISNLNFRLEHCEGIPLITNKEDNLSDIDPYHRYTNYNMKQYFQKWLNSKSNQPFLLWLEANENVTSDDFSIDSRYEQPIENTKVNITNGNCYNKLCSKANSHLVQDGVYL